MARYTIQNDKGRADELAGEHANPWHSRTKRSAKHIQIFWNAKNKIRRSRDERHFDHARRPELCRWPDDSDADQARRHLRRERKLRPLFRDLSVSHESVGRTKFCRPRRHAFGQHAARCRTLDQQSKPSSALSSPSIRSL